jgi:hypothetical protein
MMKIIINSDILWTSSLIRKDLTKSLQDLLKECKEKGHNIIIPQTALFEFNRLQLEYVELEISKLKSAYELLGKYDVPYKLIEPSRLILKPDLIELIKKLGVEVIVENPTLDDFVKAHERACLHQPPGLKKKKYDEMRDLIIWMIAIRIASTEGKALLISNDEIHTSSSGDKEADSVGLLRLKSIEDALAYFGLETPSGILIKSIIEPIWGDLLEAGLPIEKAMSMIGVIEPIFVQGVHGISKASGLVAMKTSDGKTLKANMDVMILSDQIESVYLSDINIEGALWKDPKLILRPRKPLVVEKDDYEERIKSLKEVVGG